MGTLEQRSWSHFLLGVFPMQGSNLCLLHLLYWQEILYHHTTHTCGNIRHLPNSIYLELPNLSLKGSGGTEGETLVRSLSLHISQVKSEAKLLGTFQETGHLTHKNPAWASRTQKFPCKQLLAFTVLLEEDAP